jgi:Ca-activated chloride channel family protein
MIWDWMAVGISILILAMIYFFGQLVSSPPLYLLFSSVSNLEINQQGRQNLAAWPKFLQWFSLICFLLAFSNPQLKMPQSKHLQSSVRSLPTEGIALYLVLDQSGSMNQTVDDQEGNQIRKIDLLKEITEQFVQTESSNLMGLVAFARIPHVLAPLTLDQNALLNQIRQIDVVKDKNQDGTGIGYAIFKTANIIAATRHFGEELRNQEKPPYDIKGAAMIIVTDGLQDPNPLDQGNRLRTMDLDEAAAYAKSQGIRVYLINIDPSISGSEFAAHRRLMNRITEMTGGRFYLVSQPQDLQRIYQDINQIEKSLIYPPN